MTDVFIAREERLAARRVAGEMVILSADDSSLYVLNELGTILWEAADGATPLHEIVRRVVCEEYEVDAEEASDEVVAFWQRMMKRYGSEDEYNKRIVDSFKHGEEPEILIVVDKLLTGFDAPRNTVLYLTRRLTEHTLLQAIARVNRLYEDDSGARAKEFGYVIDYVGILGDKRLEVLPIWELSFDKMPEESRRIATERLKWSLTYRKKHGIVSGPARELPDKVAARIRETCKRVYRNLMLSGYARIDLRLREDGEPCIMEANPNPQLSSDEDFADAARAAGIEYPALVQRIVELGLRFEPSRLG